MSLEKGMPFLEALEFITGAPAAQESGVTHDDQIYFICWEVK